MIRYSKLGFVELGVSNLDVSIPFYADIVGLEFVGRAKSGAALFRCDQEPYSLILSENAPGLRGAGWSLENDAQFGALAAALRGAGVPFERMSQEECGDRQVRQGLRTWAPNDGLRLEFYTPAETGRAFQFTRKHTSIQRLGHVVWMSPHATDSIEFFRDILNFRMSDAIGEVISFMRPFPSPYHHGIGIGRGERAQFNHLNFMVAEIDDLGKAIHRFRQADVPIVYGPGRHPASMSVFLYFLDPDGLTLEYSFGMEEFDEVMPRAARVLPPKPESLDTWGAVRDPRFGTVGAIGAVGGAARPTA